MASKGNSTGGRGTGGAGRGKPKGGSISSEQCHARTLDHVMGITGHKARPKPKGGKK